MKTIKQQAKAQKKRNSHARHPHAGKFREHRGYTHTDGREECAYLQTHTSDGLLQELGDGVSAVAVDGAGEHKLPLHLHETVPQQSPTPTQRLSHQGLNAHKEKHTPLHTAKLCHYNHFLLIA